MKILALGDPHGVLPKNLDSIIKKNKVEAIICIGEIYPVKRRKKNRGQTDLLKGEQLLENLCSHKIPIIVFKGNMFFTRESQKIFTYLIKRLNKKYKNLTHKTTGKKKIHDKTFILFDMIYEKHSHEFISPYWTNKKRNNKRLTRLNKLLKENPNAILLSHAPPYKCVDKIISGKHVGSKILRKAIEKHGPKLVLCGHIHEAKGEGKIGKTSIVNLGFEGDYKIFDI